MSKTPTLEEIVQAVERLPLRERRKAPQGRKPIFVNSFIIGLAVYQKLAGFRYAQQMLAVLASLGKDVPAPTTFCKRKAVLLGQIILVVKQLCADGQATKQHLDLSEPSVQRCRVRMDTTTSMTLSSTVSVFIP